MLAGKGCAMRWKTLVAFDLLPHEVKTGGAVEQLCGVGEEVFSAAVEQGGETLFGCCGLYDCGFTMDADLARGRDEGGAIAADFIDEAERAGIAGRSRPGRWLTGVSVRV